MHGYRLALKILTLSESKFCFKGQPISSPPPYLPPPLFTLTTVWSGGIRTASVNRDSETGVWKMNLRGLKRFEPHQRDGFVGGRIATRHRSIQWWWRGVTGEERGRKQGTEEPSQIHSVVGLRRIDRAVATQLVRNINVNGGNMRPIRSQFHSRPDTPTPWLSPSDQNRAATPAFHSLPPTPANLHPLIGARVRSATRNYARQLLAVV